MADPLTGLLALIDRVIALINQKEKQQQTIFGNIVEPLFKEIEPVVQDSIQILRDVRDLLENSSTAELSMLTLRQQRERLLLVRQKLRIMIDYYKAASKDDEVMQFLEAVENCLLTPISTLPIRDSPLVRVLRSFETGFNNVTEAKEYVEETISSFETCWRDTARAYMVVKQKYVLKQG